MMTTDQDSAFDLMGNLDDFWMKTNPRPIRSGVPDDGTSRSSTLQDKGDSKISSPASSFFSYGNASVTSDPS
jgi:hypothetical protein